jgi:6-pyruvoyltetrahydropterin/6-carboxytetrahydropterin synthase
LKTVVRGIPLLEEIEVVSMSVTKRFHFDAAHQLVERPWTICGRSKHGHRYELEAEVFGPLDEYGMVVDYLDLKPLIEKRVVTDYLDHWDLNETLNTDAPTAENVLVWIWDRLNLPLAQEGLMLRHLRLYETPTGWADLWGPTDAELNALAGLFDAAGVVVLAECLSPELRVPCDESAPLCRAAERIGGTVYHHLPEPGELAYSLAVPLPLARAVAAALLPFTLPQKQRAQLALLATFPRPDLRLPEEAVNYLNALHLLHDPQARALDRAGWLDQFR